MVAVNALESVSYFQGNHSIDDYLDKFTDIITDAGYADLKTIVVTFQRGLDPQIQDAIATMAYGCPSNTSLDIGMKQPRISTKTTQPMKLLTPPVSHPCLSPLAMFYLLGDRLCEVFTLPHTFQSDSIRLLIGWNTSNFSNQSLIESDRTLRSVLLLTRIPIGFFH